jgi:hypothetical protein
MNWLVVFASALASGACVRTPELSEFACGNGGPCPDVARDASDANDEAADGASADAQGDDVSTGVDAEMTDVAPADFGPIDSGIIPPSCAGAMPIPPSGFAGGDTTNARDNTQGSCATQMGGHDVLYGTGFPGDLSWLDVSTGGSRFDTVLYMFFDDCNVTSELRCNDDRVPAIDTTSRIHLKNVAHGQYFFVVDGYDANAYGIYGLRISGSIAAGAQCDPALNFLACDQGYCLPDVVGSRCQMPKDCASTACTMPPVVTCPGNMSVPPGSLVPLSGAASSNRAIAARAWSIVSAPSTLPIIGRTHSADTTSVAIALAGTYKLRYTAIDEASQAVSCNTTIDAQADANLPVELYWDPPDLALDTNLDLHLLTATATVWFSPTDDCDPATCAWGAVDEGDAIGQGPEIIRVPTAMNGEAYRVGVHYVGTDIAGAATAHVRILCFGIAHEIGPGVLPNGSGDPNADNSFWKVADVAMNATDCTVTPLVDGTNNPLVVTSLTARQAR